MGMAAPCGPATTMDRRNRASNFIPEPSGVHCGHFQRDARQRHSPDRLVSVSVSLLLHASNCGLKGMLVLEPSVPRHDRRLCRRGCFQKVAVPKLEDKKMPDLP